MTLSTEPARVKVPFTRTGWFGEEARMAMISYAQNGEDVLLNRVFSGQREGFYIDIGANDPLHDSVTKHFSLLGWRGINIEPVPRLLERLRADRPNDLNLNVGVSDAEGELTFYTAPAVESYSSDPEVLVRFFGADPASLIERTVPVRTLRDICAQYVDRTIDFLKIDVDGHERAVVTGGDWQRWRPRVVLVEDLNLEKWEPTLLEAGYLFTTYDGLNRFYVRREDSDLLPRFSPLANFSDDYIPYRYLHQIDELQARLKEVGSMGPRALGVARWLQRVSRRFPKISAALRSRSASL
jgi:FkbM family methyltransferase